MLTELRICNLGVIESVHVVLGRGLTALTGETGAGKTMLVEAISLLVGGRADPAVVRPGAAEATVEGRFEHGDEELVLTRVVPAAGRSRAYVNGRLATAAQLAEVAARLVDIHGQHEHQRLLAVSTQRDALDSFGAIDLGALRACRARLTEIDASLAALGGDSRSRAREVDLLLFQLEELDAAALDDPDEEARLQDLEDVLADAQAHREAAAAALVALAGDGGALDAAGRGLSSLGARVVFVELAARLRSVAAELQEVVHDLRVAAESIDEDPSRLAQIGARRQQLRALRRKYGETLAEVIVYRDETRRRLDELNGYEAAVADLEQRRLLALEEERAAAAEVGTARRRAAQSLARAVEEPLRELALARAAVDVAVGTDDPGDDVTFLFSANPGMPLLPLQRVASGGELARVMLAVRLVLSDDPTTLVFDEVDAGIGGAAATAVAHSLSRLGRLHQVLVVTHLAQVAAVADDHLVVDKVLSGDMATAHLTRVRQDDRVGEIARMLSGDPSSSAAREHAAALLAALPVDPDGTR